MLVLSFVIAFEVQSNKDVMLEDSSIRALFDEDFFWMTPEGADKYVMSAKKAGFNVLVPCIWHGNGATWISDIAPYGKKWTKGFVHDTDPLKYLINKAHQEGLQVHVWFTVMLRTDDIFGTEYDESMPKMFNIHDNKFGDYISEIIQDVVKRYDVDGVNLDYIRSKEICESLYCQSNYKMKTKHDLKRDLHARHLSKNAKVRVVKWQTEAVTNIVRKISNKVKEVSPTVVISVDTLVNDDKWQGLGAYSSAWLNEGIIDYIFHMDYQDSLFIRHINKAKKVLDKPERMLILVANYDFDSNKVPQIRPVENVRKVMLEAKSNWPKAKGIGLYEYRFINDQQVNMIRKDVFSK